MQIKLLWNVSCNFNHFLFITHHLDANLPTKYRNAQLKLDSKIYNYENEDGTNEFGKVVIVKRSLIQTREGQTC